MQHSEVLSVKASSVHAARLKTADGETEQLVFLAREGVCVRTVLLMRACFSCISAIPAGDEGVEHMHWAEDLQHDLYDGTEGDGDADAATGAGGEARRGAGRPGGAGPPAADGQIGRRRADAAAKAAASGPAPAGGASARQAEAAGLSQEHVAVGGSRRLPGASRSAPRFFAEAQGLGMLALVAPWLCACHGRPSRLCEALCASALAQREHLASANGWKIIQHGPLGTF
jgi:hypothetical protein